MTLRPDFSPEMLRGFLYARALARDGFDRRPVHARADLAAELMDLTGLPYSTIRAAFAGRLTDASARAAIWAALGHFPADHEILLTGEGSQLTAERRKGDCPPAAFGRPTGAPGGEAAVAAREAMENADG